MNVHILLVEVFQFGVNHIEISSLCMCEHNTVLCVVGVPLANVIFVFDNVTDSDPICLVYQRNSFNLSN